MLPEMERIVLDPTQPVAARIMAAKVVLPFMPPKLPEPRTAPQENDKMVRRLQEGRARVAAARRTVERLEPARPAPDVGVSSSSVPLHGLGVSPNSVQRSRINDH